MYILAASTWFTTLMRQFFFNIDKIVFNFIAELYDLLIAIARTSVLSQADILDMADRIYKLLAVFMIFKVTLSLITYVVNPDDFSDKTKGISKLGTNIITSLALLILTPYIFNYAYQLQTIILEDNSLGTLIFGQKTKEGAFSSAGDDMAFLTLSPFFTPNTSITELYDCVELYSKDSNGKINLNKECFGVVNKNGKYEGTQTTSGSMYDFVDEKGKQFSDITLFNYAAGIENGNLGLMFREDMAVATAKINDEKEYIMDYKFIFSTVVGVVVALLLITFCMDIGVRSIKLAFLQLIAPIPIISYVDPKSGKDGLFKKWYEMCFKTYISLFIRLLTIYFAVYIISMVADMKLVDIVDGSYVTNAYITIFIIIGALMFAKQLPKILEGLGIKLDGDGKFTLNPLKKIEEQAIGGKNLVKAARPIKGLATAGLVGGAAALTGHGFRGVGKAFSGAMKGEKFGKNFSASYAAARARNKQVEQMELDGVKPKDVRIEKLKNFFTGATKQDEFKDFQDSVKVVQNGYEQYYKGVLGGDKVAKMLEQRRIAAENAGKYEVATRLQEAIDQRIKDVRNNHGRISLDVKNKQELEKFGESIEKGTMTYDNDFSAESLKMGLSADIDKGLNSIENRIGKTIEHIDSHYNGRFDYEKGELGKIQKNDDGTYYVQDLKVTNGKSKAVSRAAENSDEAKNIGNLYKYMDSKK